MIHNIIERMLENPDKHGIYPTSTAYTQLEHYVEQVRMEALGWMHGYCCAELDKGGDPRIIEVPAMLKKAEENLEWKIQ